jgi:hypothetical protein
MQGNWSERADGRYRQLNSSLSSTADIIKQSKEMLGRSREELITCHRTLQLEQNGSVKNVELNVTCRIMIEQSSSKRSFGKAEAVSH